MVVNEFAGYGIEFHRSVFGPRSGYQVCTDYINVRVRVIDGIGVVVVIEYRQGKYAAKFNQQRIVIVGYGWPFVPKCL